MEKSLKKSKTVQMTGDHLLANMLRFAFPVMVSALFQRLFHAADSIVIGRFAGAKALAAIGGTSTIVELFTWGLMGLSIGTDVTVAQMVGKGEQDGISKAVHTSYVIALAAGFLTAMTGFFFSKGFLIAMGLPEEILAWSTLYLKIYFAGLFFTVIYNFCAAILRASGDTKRPMLFLMTSGAINVILNLIFVCLLHWDVAGVAIATALSQCSAACLVTYTLLKREDEMKLSIRLLRADLGLACRIIMIGLPSMLQNMLFSISNIMVAANINSFGADTIAANSAANTLENFVYVSSTSFTQSSIAFTGQNAGAGNLKNIKKVLFTALTLTTICGLSIGTVLYMFGAKLLSLFTVEKAVITYGLIRLSVCGRWLFLNGFVDVLAGSIRAMGYSFAPTCATLAGICGFRLLYIFFWFPAHRSLQTIYACYPLSWLITILAQSFLWIIFYRRFVRKTQEGLLS